MTMTTNDTQYTGGKPSDGGLPPTLVQFHTDTDNRTHRLPTDDLVELLDTRPSLDAPDREVAAWVQRKHDLIARMERMEVGQVRA